MFVFRTVKRSIGKKKNWSSYENKIYIRITNATSGAAVFYSAFVCRSSFFRNSNILSYYTTELA